MNKKYNKAQRIRRQKYNKAIIKAYKTNNHSLLS